MLALKEFANFIIRNKAHLATICAGMLAEPGHGYENYTDDSRSAVARRLLTGVTESLLSETGRPLFDIFVSSGPENPDQSADVKLIQPLLVLECLEQTLTPVLTNLEAGKFLWQTFSEVRTALFQSADSMPAISLARFNEGEPKAPAHAGESKPGSRPISDSEEHYRSLFENAPISLWEEDFSEIRVYFDRLKQAGVTDFRTYFEEHPEAVKECAAKVRIVAVNKATLELFQAQTMKEFMGGLSQIFGEESYPVFREELIALAEDRFRFESEAVNYTLNKKARHLILKLFVAPGFEDTLSKVLVTMIDITKQKHLEQQVYQSLEHFTRQIEDSTELAQDVALASDLENIFQQVVNRVQERFSYHHIHIYTLQDGVLVLQEGTGEVGHKLKMMGHKIGLNAEESSIARAARQMEPVLVSDVSRESHWLPTPMLSETKAALALPIKLRDEVLGVLDVQSDEAGSLGEEDRLLLVGLCGQLALAINNRLVEENLAKRANELETVAQVSLAASTVLQTNKLLQQVADLTKERFNLYHAHIYLLDEANGVLNLAAGAGEVGRLMVAQGWHIPLDKEFSLVAQAARTQEAVIVNDVSANVGFFPNPLLPHTRSEMAIPLLLGRRVLGVLDVQSDRAGNFTIDDRRTQIILAGQIAVALENARLFEETAQRARREQTIREITDKLRTAPNLDILLETAARELGQRLGVHHTVLELGLEPGAPPPTPSKNGR